MDKINLENINDIVISSRIRLARNLAKFPFPNKATPKEKNEIVKTIIDSVLNSNSYISTSFNLINLDNCTANQLIALVEKHLLSPEFISSVQGRSALINHEENISIMINEEDHIRLQVICDGFCLREAFELADRIETLINESVSIAFDSQFGYLTSCPSNLGTGMRASLMLHLPAIHESGALSRISSTLQKLGITIRGTYGEGSSVLGNIYQLSNQISLGLSEAEAIENLESIAKQLIEQETNLRISFKNNLKMQDKISRALGVLSSAKVISYSEFMDLLSLVKLGININSFKINSSIDSINKLAKSVQPATIGDSLSDEERDIKRADICREFFK